MAQKYQAENLDFAIPISDNKTNNSKTNYNKIGASTVDSNADIGTTNAPTANQQIDISNFLQHANHPFVVFFTLFFKAVSIVSFLILNIFVNNEALVFIIVVIFSAFDFWFVKNVSGRLLVGLRWWNEVKDDGSEVWIFESDHEVRKTSIDTTIFWGSLYLTPCFWLAFFIFDLIGIKWMWTIVCLISLILSGSNMIGYYKCSGEQKKKLSNFIMDKGTEQIKNLILGGFGGSK